MSSVLEEIIARWNANRPADPEHVLNFYVEHPDKIQCLLAMDEQERVLGFQSLKLATNANSYGVTPGWGIIGTYVSADLPRRGIGKKLFENTLKAAKLAGLEKIDATIDRTNHPGLAYYDALGFRTYRSTPDSISKVYTLI